MIFVSYAQEQLRVAERCVVALNALGAECWIDRASVDRGSLFVGQLGAALHRARIFVFVDSPYARRSYWVQRELEFAKRHRRASNLDCIVCVGLPEAEGARVADVVVRDPDELETWWKRQNGTPASDPLLPEATTSEVDLNGTLPKVGTKQIEMATQMSKGGVHRSLGVLDAWWADGTDRNLWLHGPIGTGRTTLLAYWLHVLGALGFPGGSSCRIWYWNFRTSPSSDAARIEWEQWRHNQSGQTALLVLSGLESSDLMRESDGPVLPHAFRHVLQSDRARVVVLDVSQPPASVRTLFASLAVGNFGRTGSVVSSTETIRSTADKSKAEHRESDLRRFRSLEALSNDEAEELVGYLYDHGPDSVLKQVRYWYLKYKTEDPAEAAILWADFEGLEEPTHEDEVWHVARVLARYVRAQPLYWRGKTFPSPTTVTRSAVVVEVIDKMNDAISLMPAETHKQLNLFSRRALLPAGQPEPNLDDPERERHLMRKLEEVRRQGSRIYLLTWEGSKVPRDVEVGGHTIQWTQHGRVTSKEGIIVGTYDRLMEFGGEYSIRHLLVIYISTAHGGTGLDPWRIF